MALNDTMNKLEFLLTSISKDLGKVSRGNRSAAQRVRVCTIYLEKVGKIFRKESVAAEKRKVSPKASKKGKRKKR